MEKQIVEEVEKLGLYSRAAAGNSGFSPKQSNSQTLHYDQFLAADISNRLRRVGQSLVECKHLLEKTSVLIQQSLGSLNQKASPVVTSPNKKSHRFLNELSLSVFKKALNSAHHKVQSPGNFGL